MKIAIMKEIWNRAQKSGMQKFCVQDVVFFCCCFFLLFFVGVLCSGKTVVHQQWSSMTENVISVFGDGQVDSQTDAD